jgi:glucose-1-phosphate thymidylyltransferase
MKKELFGIIPAGGRGSRLAPYPGAKELFPIGWQPYAVNGEIHRRPKVVSQYVLEGMVQAGVRHALMIVGENKYNILRYYGNGDRFGLSIAYLFQEEPLGMVHALDLAYPWVRGGRVLFGMPDTIINPPDAWSRLLEHHQSQPADVTLGVFTTNRPEKFGMIELDWAGRVIAHVDKPRHTQLECMWGFAVWEATFTELIHEVRASKQPPSNRSELVLGDVIDEALSREMRIHGYHFRNGSYLDIGTYDEVLEAQMKMAELNK